MSIPTLDEIPPRGVVWAYVRGYWRKVRVVELLPPWKVRVQFRVGPGGRRSRRQDVALEWIRLEKPKSGFRVMEGEPPDPPEYHR